MIVSGRLAPSSDTGASNSDGITRDNRPLFIGQATPGDLVQLYAMPTFSFPVLVGQGFADGSGVWLIRTIPLADGTYDLSAREIDPAGGLVGANAVVPNDGFGPVVIDTVGPRIAGVTFARASGRVLVTFQDPGSGLDPSGLDFSSSYRLLRQGSKPGAYVVTGATGSMPVQVIINRGAKSLPPGVYTLTVAADGLLDLAGNLGQGASSPGGPISVRVRVTSRDSHAVPQPPNHPSVVKAHALHARAKAAHPIRRRA